jgi:transcriptional regulator with XRE-family HTH domain
MKGTVFTKAEKHEIGERIRSLAAAARVSNADIARHCGVSRRMPTEWMKGVSVPKEPRISKLAAFLDTTRDQLLYGKSTELQNNVNTIERNDASAGVSSFLVFKSLRELLQCVSGNVALLGEVQEEIHVSTEWLADRDINPVDVVAYEVQDGIQYPPILQGSTVLIDTSQTEVVDGGIYAVDQGGLVRLWKVYNAVGGYRLVSPNSEYPDETAGTDVVIAGRVIRFSSPAL